MVKTIIVAISIIAVSAMLLLMFWSNRGQPSGQKIDIQPLGGRPGSTTNWAVLEGSTRSYSVLVDKTRAEAGPDGYAEFTVFAWIFSPFPSTEDTGKKPPQIRVEVRGEGASRSAEWEMRRRGIYFEATFKVRVRPGTYRLTVRFNEKTFEANISATQKKS